MASSIDRASRRDLSKRADVYGVYQNRIYSLFEEELRVGGLPYVQPIDRSRMGRLVSASGVRPSRAHLDQVLETCRKERIPVLVIGELTSAFTKHVSSRSNRVFWTVKKEEYTDDKGRKRTREIEDQSYRAHRTHASIEMACELRYMLVNVATGSIVNEGVLTDEASDKVDYISWNRRDEVNPADLRVKHGDGFKRVSSSDRNVIDARATLRSDEELFLENAPSLGRELAASLIESLRYYSPAP